MAMMKIQAKTCFDHLPVTLITWVKPRMRNLGEQEGALILFFKEYGLPPLLNQVSEEYKKKLKGQFDFLLYNTIKYSLNVLGKFAPSSNNSESQSPKVLDFSKFRNILGKNYAYFSAKTGLLQSHTLESLVWDGSLAGEQGVSAYNNYLQIKE